MAIPIYRRSQPRSGLGSIRKIRDLQHHIEQLMDSFLPAEGQVERQPACDIEETEVGFRMWLDLPGMHENDIKIEVNQNRLSISGERKFNVAVPDNLIVRERLEGRFYREFEFPSSVDAERTRANYENGVLSIQVPKSSEWKPKNVPIEHGTIVESETVSKDDETNAPNREAMSEPPEKEKDTTTTGTGEKTHIKDAW